MVQEARLDLIAALAVLLLGAAWPCLGQPLSTLLNRPLAGGDRLATPDPLSAPAPLSPYAPLMPSTPLAGPAPVPGQPGAPCARRPAGSLSAGGSGPGEFGQYMPHTVVPTAPGSAPGRPQGYAASTPGVDRPLYGGVDRPLSRDGEAVMPGSPVGAAAGVAADVPGATTVPPPVMDRPLWSTGGPVTPCVTTARPGQAGRTTSP